MSWIKISVAKRTPDRNHLQVPRLQLALQRRMQGVVVMKTGRRLDLDFIVCVRGLVFPGSHDEG